MHTYEKAKKQTESHSNQAEYGASLQSGGNQAAMQMLKITAANAADAMTSRESRQVDIGEAMQSRLEARFGVPMAGLKVYEDKGLQDVGAHGYAKGNEIHIAAEEYNPHTLQGQELLFHEAGHVVQQGAGMATGSGLLYDSGLESHASTAFAAPEGFSMPSSGAGPIQGGMFGWLKKKLGIGGRGRQAQAPPC